jgi:hypothetical protein
MRSILRAQLARLASMSVLPAILCGCASSGLVVTGGCSGVRQDRTITFSADGTQVAVQHDRDGIFVADSETCDISKIFDPPRDIVAALEPSRQTIDFRHRRCAGPRAGRRTSE